ncbi:MAG: hypothetical protein OXH99_19610 [Bryobacterales bacterium]|nr:hypothetical protein [Bryobacterales bacterium]
MFSAEYVQPPALSIPLGNSGSSVEVRRNENLTFSAMIGGEWVMITADTTVMAENGNVYAAVLSPEGVPIGVMHVAAMQEVMLGALGGTITLTQAEDMTWWLGEAEVKDGYVHTAANGNMYALMMDAEGMWSAMYQKVMVMVTLGTQGSVELVRAEDMSWWLGSVAVDVGSEVMSDNGNTYTLWYTDGVWSARFEPESMMIEGTGLIAMTREADDMYDVGGATLPATGMGDITVDGAMYHVWMQDGALAGARFDGAIDVTTDRKTGSIALPVLSANDPDTAANELRTHLILTGSAVDKNEGMFSIGALLGSGMATDEGSRFVEDAADTIGKARSDVAALLSLETTPAGLSGILDTQWNKVKAALDTVFNTDSDADTGADSAVRLSTPRSEDILNDIDDILDALSSEDAFVAATADGGGGVFASQELGTGAATDAFNRVTWSATATMGATGATRYGTGLRKTTANARSGLSTAEVGAFSYSTMAETVRTSEAAAISLTGIASYTGGTEAISADGTTYSGNMDLQVRFSANTVSGVVSGLLNADGLPWQHNFADVDRIVLDDARLRRDSTWTNAAGTSATVFYTADSGLLRPITGLTNTFDGILLGTGADAGSQANGTWSVNASTSNNYLTGGYGVMHVGDAVRPRPEGDTGGASEATLITTVDRSGETPAITTPTVTIGDGKLTVKVQRYDWVRPETGNPTYIGRTSVDDGGTPEDDTDDTTSAVLATAEFNLEALAGKAIGAKTTVNGPKWADSVKATLEAQRDQIATLQALGTRTASTRAAEAAAWQIVQDTVQYRLFGGDLPMKLAGDYATDTDTQEDAVGLIDRMIDALANTNNLFAALDPDGTGIFDHFDSNADADATAVDPDDIEDFIEYDATVDRRWELYENNQPLSAFLGEREYKVVASLGTTDYTRFGIWYRIGSVSAARSDHSTAEGNGVTKNEGGPGSFAYSPLDPTMAGSMTNPAFPLGGSARYIGETVAIMDEDVLTGTARVDVSWAAVADTGGVDLVVGDTDADGTVDDTASNAGSMTLTLGGLADSTGDPLAYTAAIGGVDAPANGHEIAEIVFSGMTIEVGLPGANSGHLIVGAEGTADTDTGNYTYAEIGVDAANVRYRFAALGTADASATGATASVGALFVGQGVDGPLGVIGTFALDDDNLARVNGTGLGVEEGGVLVRGGFGADVP